MLGDYQLVQLAGGAKTLFSASYGEKMHPGLGPQAEAELLYVQQLKIRERLQNHSGEFVIWDVGLGAAANAIAALRATREIPGQLRIVSFDNTTEPLEFALKNSAELGYLAGYENQIAGLLRDNRVEFENGKLLVNWEFHPGDFPALTWQFAIRNSRFENSFPRLTPFSTTLFRPPKIQRCGHCHFFKICSARSSGAAVRA